VNVKREIEGGIRAKVSARTPVVVTCQLGLNVVRYPTLPNIMKAKKKDITTIDVNDLLKEGSVVETISVFIPEKRKGGIILEGKQMKPLMSLLKS